MAWRTLSSQPQPVCFPRPWELLLCSSCAAEGTHRRCSYLSNNADAWECKACAGMGTGKRQIARSGPGKAWQQVHGAAWPTSLWPRADCSLGWRPVLLTTLLPLTASSVISEVTGPSTASQRGLLPSHGSTAPESGSSSTASPAPSGPVHSSQVPESGSLSSQLGTGHGDDDIYNHPQRCRGSSRAAAPSGAADRCTPTSASQRASLSSRASLAVGSRRSRQGERTRTRSRSPIQSQAPDSHSHPQRCSRRSRAPAPRAEGGSQLNTRRGALGSSRDSTAAHQRSQSRQREQARARSRSPVGRGPAESRGQLQRHHRSQSRR